MLTNVTETSRDAFTQIKNTGVMNKRQKQVMAVIQQGRDYSLQELAKLSKLPINVVSGRVSELKNPPLSRLEHGPKRKCSITQSTIQPVRLADKQAPLFEIPE